MSKDLFLTTLVGMDGQQAKAVLTQVETLKGVLGLEADEAVEVATKAVLYRAVTPKLRPCPESGDSLYTRLADYYGVTEDDIRLALG